MTGAQAVVAALVRHGITAGFGIPSIHNIAVYDALRQTPEFHHWVVRHEQAAGYAADGFYRKPVYAGSVAGKFAEQYSGASHRYQYRLIDAGQNWRSIA